MINEVGGDRDRKEDEYGGGRVRVEKKKNIREER